MFLEHEPAVTAFLLNEPLRRLFIKRHRLLQLQRPDHGVNLRCIDPRMAQERAHLFEVMVAFQDLHRHLMP